MKYAFGVCAAFGAGIGLGLLTAPKAGAETRQDIANAAKKASDATRAQADKLWDAAAGAVDEAMAGFERRQRGVRVALEAGRRAYHSHADVSPMAE